MPKTINLAEWLKWLKETGKSDYAQVIPNLVKEFERR